MRAMLNDVRFVPALIVGGVISFGLFLLMHHLISNNQQATNTGPQAQIVNLVQVQKSPEVQHKQYNIPQPPPPPKNPPPRERVQTKEQSNVQQQQLPVNIKFDTSSLGSGTGVNLSAAPPTDAGGYAPLTPMVRIKPMYPPDAAYQGIQGDVTTCFTVNPDGSVSSPYVKSATNNQVRLALGQAALRTILQWKFFPQKVDGNPVATPNVCQNIHFTLNAKEEGGG